MSASFPFQHLENAPFFITYLVLFIWLPFRIACTSRKRLRIPGPEAASLIFGNLREMMLGDFGISLFRWQNLYGPVYRVNGCFGEQQLVISDPRALNSILNDTSTFPRSRGHRELARILMGKGIFWVEGDGHRRHRSIMQPCFTSTLIKQLFPRFVDTARVLADHWQSSILESKGQAVIDVCPWIHRAALDIIGSAAFNYSFNSLSNDHDEIAKSYHNLLGDSMTRSSLSIVADSVLHYLSPTLIRAFDYLPGKGMRRLRNNRQLVYALAKEQVQTTMNGIDSGAQLGKDVLSQIVRANSASDAKSRMSSDEVYAQVSSFMLAGEETVADSICWALYELARNPEYQDRIRLEIQQTYHAAKARGDQDITYGDMEKMTMTVAFIKEVLRYHPALPMSIRQASKEAGIPLGQPIKSHTGDIIHELRVPKGQTIVLNTAGYNRLASVWGNDADKFYPERWLEGRRGTQASALGLYANLMTFLGGPRGCLGYRFALTEMQVILCELVRKFRFALPPGIEIRRELALVTIPVVVGDESRTNRLPLDIALAEDQ